MFTHQCAQECRFAIPFGPDQSDDVTALNGRREMLDQSPIIDGKSHVARYDYLISTALGKIERKAKGAPFSERGALAAEVDRAACASPLPVLSSGPQCFA
jgi:hypothetical protein